VVAGLGFLAFQIIWWTEPLVAFTFLERLMPDVVWRAPTSQRVVALSFDDGPHPIFTPQVLALLRQHGAHATFFLIGERARASPLLVEAIRAGGHEVANHYYLPGTTLGHSSAEFLDYLERAEHAISLRSGPRLFRPPGGLAWPSQIRLARDRGYTACLARPTLTTRLTHRHATFGDAMISSAGWPRQAGDTSAAPGPA